MTDTTLAGIVARVEYKPETGELIWRPRGTRPFDTRFAMKAAFNQTDNHGYKTGRMGKVNYKAHRVAWAIYHGEWPSGLIDHINGDRADNRIANLRVVDDAGNARNSARPKRNTSGVTGVYWFKRDSKWFVKVTFEKKARHIGYFDDLDDAIAARDAAYRRFGFHENHGR
jgi:hypothetical protein